MSELHLWLTAAPTLLTMLLLGSGVVVAAWRGEEKVSLLELLAWGWLCGTGVGSIILGGLSTLVSGEWLLRLHTVLSLALGVGCFGYRKAWQRIGLWPVPHRAWERWVLAIPLGLVAIALASTTVPLQSDGLFNWEFKARAAMLNGGPFPLHLMRDGTRLFFHPNYPLLLPLAELWLYLGVGEPHQALAKTLFPLFFAVGVCLLAATVARCTGSLWRGLAATALVAGVPMLLLHAYTLAQGFADYPLAILLLGAVCAVVTPRRQRTHGEVASHFGESPNLGQPILAGFCATLLPWMKSEGILHWGSFSVALGLLWGLRRWRTSLGVAIGGLSLWAAWQVVLRVVQAAPEKDYAPLPAEPLRQAWERTPLVLSQTGKILLQWELWGLLWPAVLLAVLATRFRRTPNRRPVLFAGALCLAPILVFMLPYLFTTLEVKWHIEKSYDRLILQGIWTGLLAIVLAAADMWPLRQVTPSPTK